MSTAVAYYRTSSRANVGADKDSLPRQQAAVREYAAAHGIEIVAEFYDAAVSGADSVHERPEFNKMIAYMVDNSVGSILVENASRFARDIIVQITGYEWLKEQGLDVVPVDAPSHFKEDTPTATLVRNVLGAVSQFERQNLVWKLRGARERTRVRKGRCEGRKPPPDGAVALAKRLRGDGLSLRCISRELAKSGYFVRVRGEDGQYHNSSVQYKAASVAAMVRG